ncbi:hypothetical protein D3C86_573720 [compost metagenome]
MKDRVQRVVRRHRHQPALPAAQLHARLGQHGRQAFALLDQREPAGDRRLALAAGQLHQRVVVDAEQRRLERARQRQVVRGRHQRVEQRDHVLHLGRVVQVVLLGLLHGNVAAAQRVLHGRQPAAAARQHHDLARRRAVGDALRDPARGLLAFLLQQLFFGQHARRDEAVAPVQHAVVGRRGGRRGVERVAVDGGQLQQLAVVAALGGVGAVAVELAGRLRGQHRAVDEAHHGTRVAVRVVAVEQFAAEPFAHELLGGDEHLRLGSAEAVDALLGVAHDEHARRAAARTRVGAEPAVERLPLQRVGVLELVDQQVRDARVEPLLHPARQRRLAQEQLRRLFDVVHVDPAVRALDLAERGDQQAREPRHALLVQPCRVLGLRGAQQLQFGLGLLRGGEFLQVLGEPVFGGDEEGLAQHGERVGQRLRRGLAGAEHVDDGFGRLLRRLVGLAAEGGGAVEPAAAHGLAAQRVGRHLQPLQGRVQHVERRHGILGIGQRELDPLRQRLAQRLRRLRAAVRGDDGVVVGQRARIAGHGLEERTPGVVARLGIVFEQFVVRRQPQLAQHGERRVAQQAREPRVEGAELHRAPAFEQAPVEPLQARHGRLRGLRRHAAHHEFALRSGGIEFGEQREPLVEPLAHFAGCLLGEGDGQDLVRLAG